MLLHQSKSYYPQTGVFTVLWSDGGTVFLGVQAHRGSGPLTKFQLKWSGVQSEIVISWMEVISLGNPGVTSN